MEETYKLEVNGKQYTYVAEKEYEDYDENGPNMMKIYHSVFDENRNRHSMDWSPYLIPSKEEVKVWIELGMPDRKDLNTNGPLDSEELQRYLARVNTPSNLGESNIAWLKKWAGIEG